eukprot:jgi/Ulvmu1/4455/UM002_0180.1
MLVGVVVVLLMWLIARMILKPPANARLKLLAVLGSGGHTAEIFKVLYALDMARFSPRVYVVADTDLLGELKAKHFEQTSIPERTASESSFRVKCIPRSREVGQSWTSSAFTTAWALIFALWIVLVERPRLILVNGPGTCLPICMAAHVLRLLCLLDVRIVFVESIARTQQLSLTGKIMYKIGMCDLFFVQWPELQAQFPKSKCVGRVY